MARKKIHENGWSNTPEARAYRNQYNKDHYARLFIRMTKEQREEIDRLAEGAGLQLVKFVLEAVEAWKEKNGIE